MRVLQCLGARGALGSAFFGGLQCSGVGDVQGSLVLRGLCCSGSAFLGSAVLEGLCCSRVCVPRGSVLLRALDFVSSPHPALPSPLPPCCCSSRPLPHRRLQLPFPSSRHSRPSQRCHLPAGSSPALILDPSCPCSSRTCRSQPSVSRFPPGSPPFPPVLPLPGIRPSCPHGRGRDSVRGDAATGATAPAKGDKDTNPWAGRSPARAQGQDAGFGGLLSPWCDRRSCRVPVPPWL